jgi:tetratricopeptide (TPR) repeat protein
MPDGGSIAALSRGNGWFAASVITGLIVATGLISPARAATDDRATDTREQTRRSCRGPDHVIAACSAVVAQAQLTPDILPGALIDRGLAYLRHDRTDAAIADFDAALALKPDDADALNDRGFAHDSRNEPDLAIADFDAAIQLRPDFAAAFGNRGQAFARKRQYERAIADYDHALALRPDFARAWFDRGTAYADTKQLDRAIADFTEAVARNSRYAAAFNARGRAYFAKGQIDQAIDDYDRALAISPDFLAALDNRGQALARQRKWDDAIAQYGTALLSSPGSAWTYNLRGMAYAGKGLHDRAIEDYDQAIRLSPDDAYAFNNRGLARARLGQLPLAIADYSEAIRLDPNYAYAFVCRGLAHAALREWASAIDDYDHAIAAWPNYPYAYALRGDAHAAAQDLDLAIADYETALRQSPNYTDAIARRDALRGRQQRLILLPALIGFWLIASMALARHAFALRRGSMDAMAARAREDARKIRELLAEIARNGPLLAMAPRPGRHATETATAAAPAARPRRARPSVPTVLPLRGTGRNDISLRAGLAVMAATLLVALVAAGVWARATILENLALWRDPVAAFAARFDADVAQTAPHLMRIAQQDPAFHQALAERGRQAFAAGGWAAVNAALFPFMESRLGVYADDAHVRTLASAHFDAIAHLHDDPSRCRELGLAPRTSPTLPFDAP